MTPNQSHISGLELALQQWNNGGPAAHFAAQLRGLIDQAKSAPDHIEQLRALVEPNGATPHALASLIGLVKAEFYVCGRPTNPISMALLRLRSEEPEWFACDQQVKP